MWTFLEMSQRTSAAESSSHLSSLHSGNHELGFLSLYSLDADADQSLHSVHLSISRICCPLFSQHGCPEKLHIHVQLADLNTNNTYCSYSSILPCAPSGSSTARQFLFIPLLAFLLQLSTAAKNFSQSKYASLNLLNTYPCFQKPLPALCSFSFTGLFPPLTPSSYRPLGAAIHIFYARPI